MVMNIPKIVNEEATRLFQQKLYDLKALADLVSDDPDTVEHLIHAFREEGDEGVINLYKGMHDKEIEYVEDDKFRFKYLVDPEKL